MSAASTTSQETTQGPKQDKLAKARLLLAKAEAAGVSPQEAEALTAKAMELMARHGIDMALLYAEGKSGREEIDPKGVKIKLDRPYVEAKGELLWQLCQPLNVSAVLLEREGFQPDQGNRWGKISTMHLFGFPSDIERVNMLYTSLLLQAANAIKGEYVPAGRGRISYRDRFLQSFGKAVGHRLRMLTRKVEDEAGSTPGVALALRDRGQLARKAMTDLYRDLSYAKERGIGGGQGGSSAGWRAGMAADLGLDTPVGGQRTGIGS